MLLLGFYLLYIGLSLILTVKVFRLVRRHALLQALFSALLTLGLLGIFFPIPIHGGFTFPLEIAWHELKRERWQQERRDAGDKSHAFRKKIEQRFSGPLVTEATLSVKDGWRSSVMNSGHEIWLDDASGLFWLGPLPAGRESITPGEAKAFCRALEPVGHWALPSEAELALFWQHQGHRIMPGSGQSSLAMLIDMDLQTEMVIRYIGKVPGNSIRCVAISTTAPRGGYSASDIPLSLWNNYQLSKSEIYVAPHSQPSIAAPHQR